MALPLEAVMACIGLLRCPMNKIDIARAGALQSRRPPKKRKEIRDVKATGRNSLNSERHDATHCPLF